MTATATQQAVSALPLAGSFPVPAGYFRSKLFVAPVTPNTLVAAASPLLSLLERLCLTPSLPPIESIRHNIEHELLAFRSQLDASNYTEDVIRVARYLLSATIDELLGKNYLRVYGQAAQFNSFTPLTMDKAQPEQRFFDIVAYIEQRPNQYLDLIELVYFCLITGFEGILHTEANGRQLLDNHIEGLYQLIQQHRCNKPLKLFHETTPQVLSEKKSHKTGWIAGCVAIGLVTLAFISCHIILENKAKTVMAYQSRLALLDK